MSENVNENESIQVEKDNLQQIKKTNKMMITPNTRWGILIICIAAIASGSSVYLAMHSQLIWEAMNYPYAIAFVFSVPAAIFLILLIVRFFDVIRQFLQIKFDQIKEDKRSMWFELVIVCFILVSMIEAGTFFADLIKNQFFGYFTIFALDVTAVQFMQSRKKALIHNDDKKAFIYMAGVLITALPSMFGNIYNSVLNFDLSVKHEPVWMVGIAPFAGVLFPLLIVFLAYTVDADVSKKDVVERYKDEQKIRIDLLEAQKNSESKIIEIREQLAVLKQRDSFLRSIFFPKNKITYLAELVQSKVEKKLQQEMNTNLSVEVNKIVDARTIQPSSELTAFQSDLSSLKSTYVSQRELQEKIAEVELKMETFTRAFVQWKQTLPSVIETKVQETQVPQDQFEITAERVFMRLIPNVTGELQKRIETIQQPQIPEQAVSVNRVEEIEQEIHKQNEQIQAEEIIEEVEEWKVSRVSAKDAKYKSDVGQCQIGQYTFARLNIAAEALKSKKITQQILQDIYDQQLLPSGWFKIIEVRGWGGKINDHIVMVIYPDVAKIQKGVLERMKLIKK